MDVSVAEMIYKYTAHWPNCTYNISQIEFLQELICKITNNVIHVKIMIMYSAFYIAVETVKTLKHEGIPFVLAEIQNALEQLNGDVTYGSLKSY